MKPVTQDQEALGPRARSWITLAPGSSGFLSPSKGVKQPVRGTALIRPSRHSRFSSVGSHFQQRSTTANTGVGLSHDEVSRAMHSKPSAPVTFRKGPMILENLWLYAGTALQDRELRLCDAIAAPNLLVHAPIQGKAHKLAKAEDRFTYQKVNTSAPILGPAPAVTGKGALPMTAGKHSRLSEQGTLYVATKSAAPDVTYDASQASTAGKGAMSMVAGKHSRLSEQGTVYAATKSSAPDVAYDVSAPAVTGKGALPMVAGKHSRLSEHGTLHVAAKTSAPGVFYNKPPLGPTDRKPLRIVNGASRFDSAGSMYSKSNKN